LIENGLFDDFHNSNDQKNAMKLPTDKMGRYSEASIPDDDQINRMIAGTIKEYKLFTEMDLERNEHFKLTRRV
jgi:hypothetical protein